LGRGIEGGEFADSIRQIWASEIVTHDPRLTAGGASAKFQRTLAFFYREGAHAS